MDDMEKVTYKCMHTWIFKQLNILGLFKIYGINDHFSSKNNNSFQKITIFFSFKSKDYKWMTLGFNTHIYSSLLNDQYIYIIWKTCYECPYLMKLIHCFKSV